MVHGTVEHGLVDRVGDVEVEQLEVEVLVVQQTGEVA